MAAFAKASEDTALVEFIGVAGDTFVVSGPGFGAQNIELSLSPEGMLDTDISQIWNETANGWGATWGGMRYNKRTLVLGWNVLGENAREWEEAERRFRRNWSYRKDSIIRVTTKADGVRELRCRLTEKTEQKMEREPRLRSVSNIVTTCVAGWPFWTQNDTFIGFELASGTSGTGFFDTFDNDTDMPAYLKYSADSPAQWRLADFSFGDDIWGRAVEDAARRIYMPYQAAGKNATFDSDPDRETIVVDDGSQLWAELDSDFMYCIPAGEMNVKLPVSVTRGQAGVAIAGYVPRNFQRPWALVG